MLKRARALLSLFVFACGLAPILAHAYVSAGGTYEVTVGAGAATIVLDYAAGIGGTLSGDRLQTVDVGGTGSPVVAVPYSGYRFASWSDGSHDPTRTDTNVMYNAKPSALFEPIPAPPLTSPIDVVTGQGASDMVYSDETGILYVAANGSIIRYDCRHKTLLTPFKLAARGTGFNGIDLSPDGKTLAVSHRAVTGDQCMVHLVDTATGVDTNVYFPVGAGGGTYAVVFTTDNCLLFTQTGGASFAHLFRYELDTKQLTQVRTVTEDSMLMPSADHRYVVGTKYVTPGPWWLYDSEARGWTASGNIDRWASELSCNPTASIVAMATDHGALLRGPGANGLPLLPWRQANGTAFDDTGRILFVTYAEAQSVVAYDLSTGQEVATYDSGEGSVAWRTGFRTGRLKTSASGSLLFVLTSWGVHIVPTGMGSMEIPVWRLTYEAGPHGSIEGSSTQLLSSGADGTAVTAVAAEGYHFVSWSDGVLTAVRSETKVAADTTLTATFAGTTYTLTPASGAHGTISPAIAQTVDWGGGGTFSISADSGYHIDDVLVDGRSIGARLSYSFTDVRADATITAQFAVNPPNTYWLTYSAGPGGTVVGDPGQLVDGGLSGSAVTAIPAEHHHFVRWSDGATESIRVDSNVMADNSVTAEFAIDTFPIEASAGSGGQISPSGVTAVDYGSSPTTYSITPLTGYVIGDVLVDGVSHGQISTYRFAQVSGPHTIAATFKKIPRLTITSDRTTSRYGHAVYFSGTISPNVTNGTHVTVWIRKSTSSTWSRLSTRHTYRSHHWSYSLSTRTRRHGTYYVQVRYAGNSKLTSATSSSRKIVIN